MSALTTTGLSARDPGAKSALTKGLGLTSFEDQSTITLDNVHLMTLFELRQCLMVRGQFAEDYAGQITYELLLTSMISILKADEEAADAKKAEDLEKAKLGEVKEVRGG